ncbi:MAG: AmmeMemoRadiSam system protein B [Bacteroidia bacterium]|nr:AmmeMemoRadiSam system protein B [Bacteroidia bacterium]
MEPYASPDAPVAALRGDLDIQLIRDNGEEMLLLRDPAGYSGEMLVFKPQAWALLSLFDGVRSVHSLQQEIFEATKTHVDAEQLIGIVRALDTYLFLDNERFAEAKAQSDEQYRKAGLRPAVHAGASYPEDAEELRAFLTALFKEQAPAQDAGRVVGVLAPHIDLQIGPDVYVPAFEALCSTDADTIVVLGTSHYSDEDVFILTSKHYETPLGVLPTDQEFVAVLREKSGGIFTTSDLAHRMEHSIEFPVLFLQHLFGNEGPRIVPILVTSFEEYLVEGREISEDERYAAFIRAFHETVEALGRKVVFVLSVDWSHVGRKFGDGVDAAEVLDAVRVSDIQQLEALERCAYGEFRELLRAGANATRIDGFSCITTFFDLATPRRGALLGYRQWHEEERASAVSFASMAFYAK